MRAQETWAFCTELNRLAACEDFTASLVKQERNAVKAAISHATIDDSVFLGLNTTYFVHFEDGEKAIIIQESKIGSILPKGTDVKLNLKTEKLNIFDESGDHSLMTGVVNDLDQYRKKADAV